MRTRGDLRGRGRTVTCGYGRGWTCCREMACKRSAVRARLAPLVRSEIRTIRTASTAAKYSNGGQLGRRMCVRIGHLRRLGLLAGHRVQALNRRWPACHLGKSRSCQSRDSCSHRAALLEPFPPVTVAAFASSPVACWRSGPFPGTAGPAGQGRGSLTAGSARGLGRVAPRESVRRWAGMCCAAEAQGCAVAQPRAPPGALARHVRKPGATRRSRRGRPLVGRRLLPKDHGLVGALPARLFRRRGLLD